MTILFIGLLFGIAVGFLIGHHTKNSGFLLAVYNSYHPWRVHSVAEIAIQSIKSLCTDIQYRAILARVQQTKVRFINGPFDAHHELGIKTRHSITSIHGIAISGNLILISAGLGWEKRLSRALIHVAHLAIYGTADSAMVHDPYWFLTATNAIEKP